MGERNEREGMRERKYEREEGNTTIQEKPLREESIHRQKPKKDKRWSKRVLT